MELLSFDPSRRILEPEVLDTGPAGAGIAVMRDLVRMNRWFGGRRVLPALLREFTSPVESFTLLDAGAGSGDVGDSVLKHFPHAWVVSLDLRPDYLRLARPPRVAADVFRPPFRDCSFDYVACSLFLHHFPDDSVQDILKRLYRLARRALIAVDLDRRRLPHLFIPATRPLFRWDRASVHDSQVSVQAGFRASEIAALARGAGISRFVVRKHRPWFRLSLCAPVNSGHP